jgi:sporulation protein YlmC with PRC-barrel domain
MDVPTRAQVRCGDGPCGHVTNVIVDPRTEKVTHLVVEELWMPHAAYIVPLDLVAEATPQRIQLRCLREELLELEPFMEVDFAEQHGPIPDPAWVGYPFPTYLMPPLGFSPKLEYLPVAHEHIPPGELAIQPGTRVEATDGRVGHVDGFLISPIDGHITHLVLREGHLWGQKDVTIPVSEIDRIEQDRVVLRLDKHGVQILPSVPVPTP